MSIGFKKYFPKRLFIGIVAGTILSVSTAAWDCGCVFAAEVLHSGNSHQDHTSHHDCEPDAGKPAPSSESKDECCPGCQKQEGVLVSAKASFTALQSQSVVFKPASLLHSNDTLLEAIRFRRDEPFLINTTNHSPPSEIPLFLKNRSLLI